MEERIRQAVTDAYGRIGREGARPPSGLDFPTGVELARSLGYPEDVIARIPPEAFESFVGASPLPALVLAETSGGLVLDCGAGAGVDALWLAGEGRPVAALDGSMEMLSRLARAARAARGLRAQILPLRAWLPEIPLADGFASAAVLNGVANIIPRRDRLLAELFRVLLPGGRLFIADVLRLGEVDVSMREDPDAWAFCVAGAGSPDEWRDALLLAGFRDIEVEIAETFPPLARGVLRAGKPR